MEMFKKAVVRLTLWYLAVIMLLSLFFTVVLYNVSTSELNALEVRQENLIHSHAGMMLPLGFNDVNQQRIQEINDSKSHIAVNLAYFNVIILLLGGGISYLLAKRTLEPLEESMEAQKRFTADASHELRTPLTAMKSEIEVALRDHHLSASDARELLESNLEEVNKLQALSNGLLALAKQDEKAAQLPVPVQVASVVNEAVKSLQHKAKQCEVSLLVHNETGLMVKAESMRLHEVVAILLDNAIKYSSPKSEVTVTTEKKEESMVLSVEDKGVGIAEEDIPHIFDRFYRVDPSRSKTTVEGYGLGLSIAKKIAESYNGAIEVVSKLGEGTTFSLILPLDSEK